MPGKLLLLTLALVWVAETRPPDIRFRSQMVDAGASETAAVADINRDGRLDIVSGENCPGIAIPASLPRSGPNRPSIPGSTSSSPRWPT
jgi:hypothetical protein